MGMRVTPNSDQVPINIVGASMFGDYPKISLEKTYNMFESDGFLVPFPAYHKVVEIAEDASVGRGFFRSFRGDFLVAVVGRGLYRIDLNLAVQLVGTLNTSIGEVFMDENLSQQICIVDGTNMYIYNYFLNSLTVQTGGPLDGPDAQLRPAYVTYHNTFFLIGNSNKTGEGARWWSYQTATDTTVAAHTDMAIQTKPDNALAIVRIPGQASNVLVFGGAVCEVFTQVGGLSANGQPQDYQRNSSISIDEGCLSVSTIAANNTFIAWLGISEGNMPSIVVMEGQQTRRISTDGIDFFMQNLFAPESSTAMMYRINGHLFYHLTFFDPRDNTTLIYDFNTQKFYHLSDQNLDFHPAQSVVFFNANQNAILDNVPQNIFFISIRNGGIYQLSQDFTSIIEDINFDGNAGPNDAPAQVDPNLVFEMQRVRICAPVRMPSSAPFKVNQLCFTIEMGCDQIEAVQDCLELMITEDGIRIFSESPDYRQLVPEDAGQEDCVSVPYQGRIDLAISKDGAETFSNYVPRYLNPLGIRKNILRWNKMGRVNDFTPKIRFWTLGRIVATNGYVEITP
jgi:hypothetical protein